MRRGSFRLGTAQIAVIAIAICALNFFLMVGGPYIATQYIPRWNAASITVGMTRSEVVARLGKPKNVAHSISEFHDRFMRRPSPTPPVEGEVLEYGHLTWHAYIYLDKRGNVSNVFVVRSSE